jgi:hypothetical protein
MAQTKNNFIKSRMNKDLDERLIPNGEYRDALNVEISQSEGSDVGAVNTSLGNVKITDFDLTNNCEAKIIGVFADEKNKDIYVFITNFIDTSTDKLSLFASRSALCQIWRRNIETNSNVKLVEGSFLNFSLTHDILNVNLLEDLLFWTDNRNQPRKINVNKANPANRPDPTYYTNEDQISVAKYYPLDTIQLIDNYIVDYTVTDSGGGLPGAAAPYFGLIGQIVPTTADTGVGVGLTVQITSATSATTGNLVAIKIINQGEGYQNGDIINIAPKSGSAQITLVVELQSTMKDKCSEFLPSIFELTSVPVSITSNVQFTVSGSANQAGVKFLGAIAKIENAAGQVAGTEGAIVTAANYVGTSLELTISWKNNPQTITGFTKITLGANPDYDANWPGDCEFLKDKFVRFAYRFRFDDNENSLISPFTQACFMPKQNGYFLSKTKSVDTNGAPADVDVYDSELAYESTELDFFENAINSISLKIPAPQCLNSNVRLFSELNEKMHVEEIDIIYKDDSENVIKVLDTINKEKFKSINSNYITYDYQSRAPKKVLPEDEITRVSDRVPLKSLTQEISGNRIIYGNYVDGHSSVDSLNYEVSAAPKSVILPTPTGIINGNIRREYQNHTLKQNRSYQVGVVLSDRYGRQSDVILSSIDESNTNNLFFGSTIFHPFYPTGQPTLINGGPSPETWPGDSLKVKFNSGVPEVTGIPGYPGLFVSYDPPSISNLTPGFDYKTEPIGAPTTGGSGSGLTVNYTLSNPPALGGGFIVSVVINNPGNGYQNGDVITIPGSASAPAAGANATFIYNTNTSPNITGWYSYKIVVKQQEQDYYNVYLPGIVNGAINEDGVASATRATISIYGDNINKIPKDLLDVGPSQTNYRSDTRLSLRVENTSTTSKQHYPSTDIESVVSLSELSDLGISLTKTSSLTKTGGSAVIMPGTVELQSPNDNIQSGMSVTAIDSSGNVSIPQSEGAYVFSYHVDSAGKGQVNIKGTTNSIDPGSTLTFGPAGIIFNSNNNPIVGILSTSKSIGVAEENDFSAKLAIAETKPIKSLLDIFYETTSAGLISELNSAILAGIDNLEFPVAITGIGFSLSEASTGPTVCTNVFTFLNIVNAPITSITPTPVSLANSTGVLVSVVDGHNNPRNGEFVINNNNGEFTISTNKQPGQGFYVGFDPLATTFVFTVKLTLNGIDLFKTFSGQVTNVAPTLILPTDPVNLPPYTISGSSTNGFLIPLGVIGGLEACSFNAINGSGEVISQQEDLRWNITSIKAIAGTNKTLPSDNPFGALEPVILPANTPQVEDYQIVLQKEYLNVKFFIRIGEAIDPPPGTNITSLSQFIANPSYNTVDAAYIRFFANSNIFSEQVASTTIDPDGPGNWADTNWWAGGNNSNNNPPSTVTVNVGELLQSVTWRIKFTVEDGAGVQANEETIEITQI